MSGGPKATFAYLEDLADMADLSSSTVADFEAGRSVADCLADALEVTLEAAGMDFFMENGVAVVRLRKAYERSGE
jgi:hypothetical protein